ncbi:MAG: NAD-dependent epimerase/dehydratase family protein, partial [Promethearchaeota archaeon]
MKNVLLTGGYGFIGTNFRSTLTERFPSIRLFTPTSSELNLLNSLEVFEFLNENNIEMVLHLASHLAGIGELTEKPLEYFEDNLIMNFNIIKAARCSGVKEFLTLGSTCAFSNNTPSPFQENDLWLGRPENTYGISKLAMLEHLKAQNQMKWLYLMPANAYGTGDHFDIKLSHIIPATIMKLNDAVKNNKPYISVWGDGSQVRDFIYIDDLCDIVCKFLEMKTWNQTIVNISTGIGTCIKDIVSNLILIMGLNHIEVKWLTDKPIGIPEKMMNNDRLISIIGRYQFTTIEDGLKSTV